MTTMVDANTATRVAPTRPRAWRKSDVVGHRFMATWGSWGAGHLRREDVALVSHGADQFLARAAVVELAAQPADLDVDRPVERIGLRPAGEFEQLVAAQHPLRPLGEGPQQREPAPGQADPR